MLDFDLFRRVVDEAGPSLGRIDFFNYGEAFLHKRAVEMCEYIKSHFPHIYLYTSTNGLALTEAQARRLVHSGIDEVTFSIDGATQDSYVQVPAARQLRRRHREPARDGRREAAGGTRPAVPELALHPVQVERQRRGDGRARGSWRPRSASIACAGRSPIIPRTPTRGGSCPASPELEAIRHEIWDDNDLGNAIPGATPRARIDVRDAGAGRAAHRRAAGRPLHVRTRVHNLSTRPFPGAGDLRPPPRAARRAAVRRRRRAHQPRLRARVAAADARPRRHAPTCRSRSRRPTQPGRYALKFDLVSEGIDWFEHCGSETTTKTLWVR